MSSISGMSALLTISAIAIVTMQLLKNNINIENYGETDEKGNPLNTDKGVMNTLPKDKNNVLPFENGKNLSTPYVSEDANKYSGNVASYSMYLQSLNAALPTQNELNAIGSQTNFLPGPNDFMGTSNYVPVDSDNKLSSCSQNMPTFGNGPASVASSLLPKSVDDQLKGFSDCDVNALANQVFLTNRIGTNTVLGSNRNANLSIRSEPPNPVLNVGPWLNTTIYPDLLRRPLEQSGPSFGLYGDNDKSYNSPTPIKY